MNKKQNECTYVPTYLYNKTWNLWKNTAPIPNVQEIDTSSYETFSLLKFYFNCEPVLFSNYVIRIVDYLPWR